MFRYSRAEPTTFYFTICSTLCNLAMLLLITVLAKSTCKIITQEISIFKLPNFPIKVKWLRCFSGDRSPSSLFLSFFTPLGVEKIEMTKIFQQFKEKRKKKSYLLSFFPSRYFVHSLCLNNLFFHLFSTIDEIIIIFQL